MTTGQAHTTWFPELKQILRDRWNENLTITEQFILVDDLTVKLNQIRTERNIQPPMMWCSNCKERHRSKFVGVSITAMYFALKNFEVCTGNEFNELRRKWKIYSKEQKVDIYGKNLDNNKICQSTKG